MKIQPIPFASLSRSPKAPPVRIGVIDFTDEVLDKELYQNKQALINAAQKRGDAVIEIDPSRCSIVYSSQGIQVYYDKKPLNIDVAMFYGAYYNNNQKFNFYSLLDALKSSGIPLLDDPAALRLTDDKIKEYALLAQNRVPIPTTVLSPSCNTTLINRYLINNRNQKKIIIKEPFGYAGEQVYLSKRKKYPGVWRTVRQNNPFFQEYVSGAWGRSVRVLLLESNPIAVVEFVANNPKDFRSNNDHQITRITDLKMAQKAIEVAFQAKRAIPGLGFAGVDIVFPSDNSGPKVLEVNSSPEFLLTTQSGARIDGASVIVQQLEKIALKRQSLNISA